MDTPALRNLTHGDPMLSSLLAFASGLAAKVILPVKRDPIDVEIIVRLQTELDNLRRQFDETLTRVERQRDDWQSLAISYRREVMERRQSQAQAQQLALQPYQIMQQANAQVNALAHQLTIQNGLYLGQQLGQIGMQSFGQQLEDYVRNCTPGRHELLTRG